MTDEPGRPMTEPGIGAPPWTGRHPARASTAEPEGHHDVLVIGAGIVGLCTAVLLAESGVSVAVLEGRSPGSGTTGRSTAKASLLQGTRAAGIRRHQGADTLAAYVTANQSGLELLSRLADEAPGVGETADAWTYATDREGAKAVEAEAAALAFAGLPAHVAVPDELPFPTTAAVRLADQLRLDPGALVAALLERLAHLEVPVVWPLRARGVRSIGEGFEVVAAPDGAASGAVERRLRSDWVVLATLLPFPLRTALFATASAQMSYAVVGQPTTAAVPEGMYLSAGEPTRSLRGVRAGDGRDLLLVGGSGHPVGRDLPNSAHLTELIRWAERTYGLGQVEHRWAAHDYVSADLLPHVGPAPYGPPRLLVATGFGKWGMTNGAAAAVSIAGTVLGRPPGWADAFAPRVGGGLAGWGRLAAANVRGGLALARGWVADPGANGNEPAEGSGVVRRAVPPRGVSRTEGVRRDCRAVCTHLGGIVRWNDVDQTWDCPLHGSRFGTDGSVLTGPAVNPLGQ